MNHERREKIIFKEKSYAIQDAIFKFRKMGSNLINEINKMKSKKIIFLINIFVLLAYQGVLSGRNVVKTEVERRLVPFVVKSVYM